MFVTLFNFNRSMSSFYTISSQYVRELTLSSLRSTPISDTSSPREENLDGKNKLSVKELLPLVNQVIIFSIMAFLP